MEVGLCPFRTCDIIRQASLASKSSTNATISVICDRPSATRNWESSKVCEVKNGIVLIVTALGIAWGSAATRSYSLAQTASEMRAGHQDMGGHSDHQAFDHRFEDAEKWAKEFDNPERDAWQKPEEILDALHLKANSIVADLGAGTGYFGVRIAKRIPEGKIFAI